MAPPTPDMREELKALSSRLNRLALQLSDAAALLKEAGQLPPESLDTELTESRTAFKALRDKALGLAREYGGEDVSVPAGLKELESLCMELDARAAQISVRTDALAVLDRFLLLKHVEYDPFPALHECQVQAQELRRALVAAAPDDLPDGTPNLANGTHPFAALLTLMDSSDKLDDEQWDRVFTIVKESLGVGLAAAAARGKLIVGTEPFTEEAKMDREVWEAGVPGASESTEQGPGVSEAPVIEVPETPEITAKTAPREKTSPVAPTDTLEHKAESAPASTVESGSGDTGSEGTRAIEGHRPLVSCDPNAPASEIAAALLQSGCAPAQFAPALTDLIWRLIADNRMGIAYHVAQYLESLPEKPKPLLRSWVVRAAALGPHVRYPVSEMELLLKEDFSEFSEDCFSPDNSEWNHAIRFLLVAAALQPALLAPTTGAAAILHSLYLKEGLTNLYELCRKVADYGALQKPLDPHAIKGLKDKAAWQSEMDQLQADVEGWYTSAIAATFIYAPATKVWRAWLEPDGIIYRLLQPVRQNISGKLEEVRREAERLSDRDEVQREVNDTDRNVLHRRGGEPITARALTALVQRVSEAVNLANRWIRLHEARPGTEASFLQRHAEELRRVVLGLQEPVRAELDLFAQQHRSAAVTAAIDCCRRALENVANLFATNVPLPAEEPDPRHLLHADLLHIPDLSLDDNWEPVELARERLVVMILQQVAADDWSWLRAFEARAANKDHAGTGRILQYLELHPAPGLDLDELRRRRERYLLDCQEALRRDVIHTQKQVESAVSLGLLAEDERATCIARIERIQIDLPTTERFADAHQDLAQIRQQIQAKRDAAVTSVRQRLDAARIQPDHPGYRRITEALNHGDILTANEFIDLVQAGEEIPVSEPEAEARDSFREFFPGKALDIYEQLPKIAATQVIRSLRERKTVAGVDMRRVGGTQAEQAAQMMEAWFTAKAGQKISEATSRTILVYLGFNPEKVTVNKSGRVTWIRLVAEPIRDKNRCPVAHYGSNADGHYRILCVWDRPAAEDLVNAVGDTSVDAPVIVFHFGSLTVQRRRELARLCRERRRTFIVVDDILMLFLCGVRRPRLPVLFECSLPFTFLEPYTTTAGLVPPEMFYGRQRELEAIIRPDGTSFIYGGRQLGKTALLRAVERSFHHPTEGKVAIWIDLKAEGIGYDRSIDDLWSLLATEFKKVGVLPSSLSAHANTDRIIEQIKSWLEQDQQRRILLLLDEADRFLEIDATRWSPHSAHLSHSERIKGLMDRTGRRFKVVFAGLHNVLRTTRHPNNVFAHFGEPVCIGPLFNNGDWRDARDLIKRPLAALGFEVDLDLVVRILSQTNYYPSLIQLYCNQLLRHVNQPTVAMFDPKTSPPYTITSRHVEDAYRSQELRKAIRDRFMWTLQLDPRYEVIAYAIAYESLAGDKRGMVEGFPVSVIRREALRWWPQGFPDGAPEDFFRVLLDEMVGLGVLRLAGEGRYALRSPNVLLLMGTEEEIEAQLLRPREAPTVYEPDSFRRTLSKNGLADPSRCSPLTAQQESELRSRQNGVSILFGCEAAGLDNLKDFLLDAFGEYFVDLGAVMDKKTFVDQLAQLDSRHKDGTTLIFVPHTCPWTDTWVSEALRRVARLKSKQAFVRVVFVADPKTAWRLAEQYPAEFEEGLTTFTLRPWNDPALRQWLDESGFTPVHRESRTRIAEVTGLWPLFLERFYRAAASSRHDWKQALHALDDSLNQPETMRAWAEALALNSRQVLTVLGLVASGKAATDELEAVLPEVPCHLIRQTLRWAEMLGLVRQSVDGYWAVDNPVVVRLLRRAEEWW